LFISLYAFLWFGSLQSERYELLRLCGIRRENISHDHTPWANDPLEWRILLVSLSLSYAQSAHTHSQNGVFFLISFSLRHSLVTELSSAVNVSLRAIQKRFLKKSTEVTLASRATEVKTLEEGKIVKRHIEIEKEKKRSQYFFLSMELFWFLFTEEKGSASANSILYVHLSFEGSQYFSIFLFFYPHHCSLFYSLSKSISLSLSLVNLIWIGSGDTALDIYRPLESLIVHPKFDVLEALSDVVCWRSISIYLSIYPSIHLSVSLSILLSLSISFLSSHR
jgi:hypothetical protein